MELWSELLGTWGGILSLGSIVFMISMAVFIPWFVSRKKGNSKKE
ncbi:MAG: DUF3149 domain-containing protein [Cycloclasticus sp.]|jgi:hypothetical protein|nr:DUF3149 domain-containing protein [Cycloclasticus sp.]MDF1688345.1 DUF3149 domain-containing protein [Cycloclasticus sp.]MEE4290290.1 DUF3149 domain-containing protein [Cycloclasticus sp.]